MTGNNFKVSLQRVHLPQLFKDSCKLQNTCPSMIFLGKSPDILPQVPLQCIGKLFEMPEMPPLFLRPRFPYRQSLCKGNLTTFCASTDIAATNDLAPSLEPRQISSERAKSREWSARLFESLLHQLLQPVCSGLTDSAVNSRLFSGQRRRETSSEFGRCWFFSDLTP